MAQNLWVLLLGLTVGTTAGCASRTKGRTLRFHDLREVKTPPERQEGGRAVESPARRTSAERPTPTLRGHRPLDADRMGIDAFRVYLRAAERERRRRYGPPTSRPARRKKRLKPSP